MINKLDFNAKNLTSKAGIFLLLEEAKYDINEAVFQMMRLSYNLFLLFKFDFLTISEYRQQIKTFLLKYVFFPGKIVKRARSLIMKISDKYICRDIYDNIYERQLKFVVNMTKQKHESTDAEFGIKIKVR